MENQKLRVWWRKLDEDGNEIERGVDDREYVNASWAYNRGEKLFGSRYNNPIQYHINHRDPWATYTCEVTCETCGQVFIGEEHAFAEGHVKNADSMCMFIRSDTMKELVGGRIFPKYNDKICPECAKKIYEFIKSLKGE